jgi:hypothetical protein
MDEKHEDTIPNENFIYYSKLLSNPFQSALIPGKS